MGLYGFKTATFNKPSLQMLSHTEGFVHGPAASGDEGATDV